jgi:hypothetical protein
MSQKTPPPHQTIETPSLTCLPSPKEKISSLPPNPKVVPFTVGLHNREIKTILQNILENENIQQLKTERSKERKITEMTDLHKQKIEEILVFIGEEEKNIEPLRDEYLALEKNISHIISLYYDYRITQEIFSSFKNTDSIAEEIFDHITNTSAISYKILENTENIRSKIFIVLGTFCHDIGKTGILHTLHLYKKENNLSDEQRKEIQQHSSEKNLFIQLLQNPFLRFIAKHHHTGQKNALHSHHDLKRDIQILVHNKICTQKTAIETLFAIKMIDVMEGILGIREYRNYFLSFEHGLFEALINIQPLDHKENFLDGIYRNIEAHFENKEEYDLFRKKLLEGATDFYEIQNKKFTTFFQEPSVSFDEFNTALFNVFYEGNTEEKEEAKHRIITVLKKASLYTEEIQYSDEDLYNIVRIQLKKANIYTFSNRDIRMRDNTDLDCKLEKEDIKRWKKEKFSYKKILAELIEKDPRILEDEKSKQAFLNLP